MKRMSWFSVGVTGRTHVPLLVIVFLLLGGGLLLALKAIQTQQNLKQNAAEVPPQVSVPGGVENDTTSPSLAIMSPKSLSRVTSGESITITAEASDTSGIEKVVFTIGDTLLCSDTTSPYQCTWKIPNKKNTNYTITAVATDLAGNQAGSVSRVMSE